jgi:NADPH:quinone reductase-like Zn-dependent oxidoreductase
MSDKVVVTALVAVHLAVNIWHSGGHTELAIALPPIKLAFVIGVILLAPIVSGVLVWTRYAEFALWLFMLSMVGALVFGVYHHYVLVSPDNVAHLPDGPAQARAAFIASAGVLALLELAAALYGAFSIGARRAA